MDSAETGRVQISGTPTIAFVATTPFVVNAFLANHIAALSRYYRVILFTNLHAYKLQPFLFELADVRHVPFARKISLGDDLRCLMQLAAAIRKLRPAAVHSITPKAGLLAMMAGWIVRVPNRWHTFTGQVWATRKGMARRLLKALDHLIVLLATRVFADSPSQCRFLHNQGVVREGQLGMLGSGSIAGVDIDRFRPDPAARSRLRAEVGGAAASSCIFLFVGRLTKDKGLFDLISAFREVAKEVHDAELWVVGPDEDGLQHQLQMASGDCLAPIRWLGATTEPETFMAAADVLLLPSYREGFGSVIIEAAACGIPAVAYRIDGVIDAVLKNVTGLLVEVGETQAFALAMKSLALDGKFRLRLGQQARERAVRDFSSSSVTGAWLVFYRSRLGPRPR